MSRYSFEVISKVIGVPGHLLQQSRRNKGMTWERDYDLDGVRQIIGNMPLVPRESINPRAHRALELWDALNEKEEKEE